MNLMVYEYGDEAVIVDCGMMFPDAATRGVDGIVPEMRFVCDTAAQVTGGGHAVYQHAAAAQYDRPTDVGNNTGVHRAAMHI